MASYETHDFYCLNCGKKSIPLQRKRGQQKEPFHRKKLYCIHCHNIVNHIECKNTEQIKKFQEDFKQGVYKNEAQESLDHVRTIWLR